MIDNSQQTTINKYLQSVGIEQMELFEELYDHTATSFENRTDKTQSLEEHIRREVAPELGGRVGIKKLKKTHQIALTKAFGGKLIRLYLQHFYKWPHLLITMGVVGGLAYFGQDMKNYNLYSNAFQLSFILPFVILTFSINRFSKQCKATAKPYTKTWTNEIIFSYFCGGIIVLSVLLYLASLVLLTDPGVTNLIIAYPLITIPVGTLYILHAVSSLRLYKQDFYIKLQIG